MAGLLQNSLFESSDLVHYEKVRLGGIPQPGVYFFVLGFWLESSRELRSCPLEQPRQSLAARLGHPLPPPGHASDTESGICFTADASR